MKLTLSLTPAEESKLLAEVQATGITPEQVIRVAIQPIVSSDDEDASVQKGARSSLLGIWAKYGLGPTEQDIDSNRVDMFSTFGRDDIA